jgi:hypothetical protein
MPAAPPSVVASSASVDSQGNLKTIKVYVFCKTNMKGATFEVSKRETVGDLLGKIEQRQAAMLAGAKAGAFRSTAVVSTNLMTTFTGRVRPPPSDTRTPACSAVTAAYAGGYAVQVLPRRLYGLGVYATPRGAPRHI